jgi:hypothetical protein
MSDVRYPSLCQITTRVLYALLKRSYELVRVIISKSADFNKEG